jgi:hypothetical protein
LAELQSNYSQLLEIKHQKLRATPSLRLATIQKRLENMFELLNSWQQYVDVIYMSEAEATLMATLQSSDVRPDELSYKNRKEQQEISERLNTLFGKESEIAPESKAAAAKIKGDQDQDQNYETVEEGITSDTASENEDGVTKSVAKSFEASK